MSGNQRRGLPMEPTPLVEVVTQPTAMAGLPVTVTVAVTSRASESRIVVVQLVGLDPSWTSSPSAEIALAPDERGRLDFQVAVPAGVPSGSFPFVVAAQALQPGTRLPVAPAATFDAVLQLGDHQHLSVRVEPRELHTSRFKRFRVFVNNPGDHAVDVELDPEAPPQLTVRLRQSKLRVPAHSEVKVRGSMWLPRRRYLGQSRRVPFAVNVLGGALPARHDGALLTRAALRPALLKPTAFLLVIALWLGAVVVGLQTVSSKLGKQTTVSAQGKHGSGNQGDGGSGSGGGDGGAGGSGGGGAGGASGGKVTTTKPVGRLNGTVTGPAANGVKVTLQPTSLVDEKAEGATFVGFVRPVAYTEPGKVRPELSAYSTSTVSPRRSTTTSKDGAWAFAKVTAPGYYLLTFAKPGYQTRRYVIDSSVAAAVDAKPLSVELSAGAGSLTGKVAAANGTALGGATVTITDGDVSLSTSSATKGPVGSWRVDGVSTPGTYLVSVSRDGYGLQSRLVTLDAGKSANVDFALKTGEAALTGTVSGPDGLPLGGITVTATDGTITRTATTITNGAVGNFTLPGLPAPGKYTVSFTGDGYQPQTQQVQLSAGQSAATLSASLQNAAGSVTGRVLDAASAADNGKPGAGIVLKSNDNTYKTVTDDTGLFRMDGVVPGDYVVTATYFGYQSAVAKVKAVASGTVVPDLVLSPQPDVAATGKIRGQVVNALTGGKIDKCLSDAEPCALTATTSYTDSTGKQITVSAIGDFSTGYLLPSSGGLPPGLYTVTLHVPGFDDGTVKVQVGSTEATAATVALKPKAQLQGTILAAVNHPPSTTCVVLVPGASTTAPSCTTDGLEDGDAANPATATKCTVDAGDLCSPLKADFSYDISGISAGTYTVWVVVPSTSPFRSSPRGVTQILESGQTRTYNATINRRGRFDVTVLAPNGAGNPEPVKDAAISVDGQPNFKASGPTDDAGHAILDFLDPGTWQVRAATAKVSGVSEPHYVADNQTVFIQVVLTTQQTSFAGRVVVQVDGKDIAIANDSVTLTGIVGYSGQIPQRKSVTVVTDDRGCFYVVQQQGGPRPIGETPCDNTPNADKTAYAPPASAIGTLALVTSQVDVSVAPLAPYPGVTRSDVPIDFTSTNPMLTVYVPASGAPFKGQLATDPSGGQLQKATLTLTKLPAGAGAATVSVDSTGAIHLTDPTLTQQDLAIPGTYRLVVALSGYDTLVKDFVVDPSTGVDLGTLTLEQHFSVKVNLVDSAGKAVSGIVTLKRASDSAEASGSTSQLRSSASFGDLSLADSYLLSVRAPGYAFLTDVPLATVDPTYSPTAGGTSTISVTLQHLGSIAGTLYGDTGSQSVPLPGVKVTATSADGTSFSATTDAAGVYSITGDTTTQGLSAGDWTLSVDVPGYQSPTPPPVVTISSLANGDLSTADPGLHLAVSPVNLTVEVVDDQAHPVWDASVTLKGNGVDQTLVTPSAAAGAPNATVTFNNVVPVQYSLNLTAAGHAPVSLLVTPRIGQTNQNITVTLAGITNTVQGDVNARATDGSLTPITDATVNVTAGDGTTYVPTTSGSNFKVTGLPDGDYTVSVSRSGFSTVTRTVSLAGGQTASLDVQLVALTYSATVTVVSKNGFDLSGTTVSLTNGGSPPSVVAASQLVTASSTANQYVTTFNGLAPGTYTMVTQLPNGHYGSAGTSTVTVAADGTVTDGTLTVTETEIDISASLSGGCDSSSTTVDVTAGAASNIPVSTSGGVVTVYTTGSVGTPTATATDTTYTVGTLDVVKNSASQTTVNVPVTAPTTARTKLTVTVQDSGTSKGINGATVAANGSAVTTSDTTQGAGTATLQLCPGTYNVTVSASGYSSKTQPVTVTSTNSSVTIALDPLYSPPAAVTATVVVQDSSSKAVSGASVTLTATGYPTVSGTTGSTGSVTFSSGLTSGVIYSIAASATSGNTTLVNKTNDTITAGTNNPSKTVTVQ